MKIEHKVQSVLFGELAPGDVFISNTSRQVWMKTYPISGGINAIRLLDGAVGSFGVDVVTFSCQALLTVKEPA